MSETRINTNAACRDLGLQREERRQRNQQTTNHVESMWLPFAGSWVSEVYVYYLEKSICLGGYICTRKIGDEPSRVIIVQALVLFLGNNVLCAKELGSQIHHISDSLVGDDLSHPQNVVQGGIVARVTVVVEVGRRRREPAVLLHDESRRDELTAHISEARGEVRELPVPPKAIQVGMVQEEDRVTGAGVLILHLIQELETLAKIGMIMLLTVPPVAR